MFSTKSDGNHTYTYDAENRIIQVDGGSTGTYTYDAAGRRVARQTASGSWEYLYDLQAGR
jgi:YD repeat-containing protein